MNAALARRQAALAGVALVGALGAIALSRVGDDSERRSAAAEAAVEWETARASPSSSRPPSQPPAASRSRRRRVGIAHPVLPCGAKLVLDYQGQQSQADVVESGPVEAGRAFELTPALAQQLGVSGTATVRWRFAE